MAIEIVSFPINSMVMFHSFLYVYQRVTGEVTIENNMGSPQRNVWWFPDPLCPNHPSPGLFNHEEHLGFCMGLSATSRATLWDLVVYWLVVWNMAFIFPYIGNNGPNWRTHIFQRGGSTTNQFSLIVLAPLATWSYRNCSFCWLLCFFLDRVSYGTHPG